MTAVILLSYSIDQIRLTFLPAILSAYLVSIMVLTMRPVTGSIDFAVKAFKASAFVLGVGLLAGAFIELALLRGLVIIVAVYSLFGALLVYTGQANWVSRRYRERCRQGREKCEEIFGSEEPEPE